MKILVTGGAGFIASHIVDNYVLAGHEVVVVDNLSSGKKEYVNSKAHFFEADICDEKAIRRIFSEFKPEVVNHHAAQISVRESVADPAFDAKVNVVGFITILNAAQENGAKKILFASSGGAIYGENAQMPTSESIPPHPASPYGTSKLCGEHYLEYYYSAYGISFVALRYGNVYGPRQNPHGEAGVVAIFTKKLLSGEIPTINGDGEQMRDFVFVGDVASANVKALNQSEPLFVNIGTGVATSVNVIFSEIAKSVGSTALPQYGTAKLGEQRKSLLNVEYAATKLQWQPKVSLRDGIVQTVEFFKNEKK